MNKATHKYLPKCRQCGNAMSEREWIGRFLTGYVCPSCCTMQMETAAARQVKRLGRARRYSE